jgi:diaminohydroxyphosphoribosylaminopyrimidine deaminase/5-amino-6-(5-phosphoribosylamino)uracil reductase
MNPILQADMRFMSKAINLARKAEGLTSPNPMVGALLVKDGRIIAEDFHKKAGTPHAETLVISCAGPSAKGSTMYVNLEPCNHYGKTPPCVDAIIAAGITRVVVAMKDPNPNVKGGGIEKLKEAGVRVDLGILQERASLLNEKYLYYVTTGMPFVIVKTAVTLDGKIATKKGDSQWISTPRARKFAHLLRNSVDAVAIGSGTMIKDDPLLTVRLGRKNGITHRIIFDSKLRTNAEAKLFSEKENSSIFFITTDKADRTKRNRLEKAGAVIINAKTDQAGYPDIVEASAELARRGITSLLVEGGAKLIASFIKSNCVNKLIIVYAPLLIGGRQAVPLTDELGVEMVSKAYRLKNHRWKKFGDEMIFSGYFK